MKQMVAERRECNVEDCRAPRDSRGLCKRHAERARRGRPVEVEPPSVADRLKGKCALDSNGCWVWSGQVGNSGYGKYSSTGLAHRVSYETFVGPIPDGLTIDHLCLNKMCINPAHLEPVTSAENARRRDVHHGIGSAKTHCPQGHEYSLENTRHSNGRRHCRACARIRTAIRYRKNRNKG